MLIEILMSTIGFMQPKLPLPEFHLHLNYVIVASDCPSPANTQSLRAKYGNYGIENAVAEFDMAAGYPLPGGADMIGIEYLVRAYKSGVRNNRISTLSNWDDILRFLQRGDFNIIQIYDKADSRKGDTKPIAIIYKEYNHAYAVFYLEERQKFPEGNLLKCFEPWSPNVITNVTFFILNERLRRGGFIRPIPRIPKQRGI